MRSIILTALLGGAAIGSPLSKRATGYSSGDTASDVQNDVCAPLTVVFARGTSESGNIGSVIGPPLFQSLSSKLSGNVALQGVNYPADVEGDFDGGSEGGSAMTSIVQQALQQCPSTKIALAGYSQGGLVIHYALNNAGLSSSSVSAIVYFGDPDDGIANSGSVPASEIKEYCASGDGVCEDHTFSISSAHLSYGSDADDAANFIINTAGAGTSSGGSGTTTTTPVSTPTSTTPAVATTSAASILCKYFPLLCR